MPILLKVVTYVKFPGENAKRVIDMHILIANALPVWEIIRRIIINPYILRILIENMLLWLRKIEILGF